MLEFSLKPWLLNASLASWRAGRWMTGGQAWVSTWEVRHLGMWVTRALRAWWRGAAGWQVGLSFQRFKLLYIYVYAVAVPRMGWGAGCQAALGDRWAQVPSAASLCPCAAAWMAWAGGLEQRSACCGSIPSSGSEHGAGPVLLAEPFLHSLHCPLLLSGSLCFTER